MLLKLRLGNKTNRETSIRAGAKGRASKEDNYILYTRVYLILNTI
jgi:hypothetical protein